MKMVKYLVLQLVKPLLLLFVAGQLVAKERGRLSLGRDGAYMDMVIAIDRNSPEDPALVDKTMNVMREFSDQLIKATMPMFANGVSLRLGHVFILLPRTWTNHTRAVESTWQTYENSDIRLGNSPGVPHYTSHGGRCGTLGDFIVFDTNHMKVTGEYWLGKQMLSEFGRFRWGLLSEHNGEGGPHFYFEGGKIVPAICNQGIKGSFRHNVTQQLCNFDSNTLELDPNCRFYPDLHQEVEASLLSTTGSRNIVHFCDSWHSGSNGTKHNRRAPVPLNRLCMGHSGARDVMRKGASGDFRLIPAPPNTPPPVQFTIVRPMPYRRLVIVIDVSSSMSGNPINKIKAGLEEFILELLEEGIQCALVTFNDEAKVIKSLDRLNTLEKRKAYAAATTGLIASGYTAIGDGLCQAMKVLGVNPWVPTREKSGYILLLSDGGENRYKNFTLPDAANALKRTSIIVDTVSFGNQADKRLTQLSEDTNGLSFFTRFGSSVYDFVEQLSKTVRDRVKAADKPVDIFSAPIAQKFNIPILIDASVGKDTSFLLSTYRSGDINSMDMKVVSPNGSVYDKNSPQYTKDTTLGKVSLKFSGVIEYGAWRVTDGTSVTIEPFWSNAQVFNTLASLSVSSKPSSQEEPVILDGSVIGETQITLNGSTVVVIVASLTRGAQLYPGAKILAKIESENEVVAVLPMQDNGVYPDIQSNDGLYSTLVPLKSISKVLEYNVRLICESPVSRVSTAGKIYVKSVDANSLLNLPPATVQDFKVGVDLWSKTLRLSFTAVGKEQNDGTADKYIFKSSLNDTLLNEQFHSADNVSVLITPLPAGSLQVVNISSSDIANYNGSTFYLAMMAINSKGVASSVSNLVATQLTIPDNVDIIDGGGTTIRPEILATTKAGVRNEEKKYSLTFLLIITFGWHLAVKTAF